MREMKDSGIGWIKKIPENWNLIRNKYNFTLSKYIIGSKWCETQLLSLTKNGVKEINDGEQTGKVPASLSTYQKVTKNDIVMCLFDLDCSAVFSGRSNYDGMISPAYKCFKCNESLNPEYVDFYFRTVFVDRKYMRYSKNVRYSLASDEFLDLPILVPPIDEQKRIATYLDEQCKKIDEIMADIQNQIDTLEDYKKSVISEAVTRGLDPNVEMQETDMGWIKQVPAKWNISRIASVYELRNEKVSDKDYQPLSVTMKGVLPQLDTVAKSDAHDDRKLVRKGDFAINSRSDRRGSCGIAPCDGSISLINTVLCPLTNMNPIYYNWLFHTTEFADEFYKWGHGIVDDLWTTGWQEMKNILIPVPPVQEQEEIAKYLNKKCADIDSIIEDKKAQFETIENYKKSLIYEYVTGKKEVPENE